MEFAFQENTFSHLQMLADEWVRQEELADIIVPDSFPDVERIIDSFASVTVRSKECRAGNLLISGAINAGLLYLAESESTPRLLETYMPFSIKKDLEGCDEQSQAVVVCRCAGVDGRVVNSRKVMILVNLSCGVQLYQQAQQTVFAPEQTDERLQLHRQSYPLTLPVEVGEKLFSMEEEMELPVGKPAVEKMLHYALQPELTEARVAGNRLVFKGSLRVRLLYLTAENQIEQAQMQLPFSQFCDLAGSYDGDNLQLQFLVTNAETAVQEQSEGKRLDLSATIQAQCVIYGEQLLPVIDDAYWLGGSVQAQTHPYSMRCILQRQQQSQTVRAAFSGDVRSISDVQIYLSQPEVETSEEKATVRIPVHVALCYRDADGNYHAASERAWAEFEQAAGEHSMCQAFATVGSDLYAMPTADGAEVRFTVELWCSWNARCSFETICALEAQEEQEDTTARPSVILRTLDRDCTVWQLAKQMGTTTARICAANGITDETVPAGMLLLMPLS